MAAAAAAAAAAGGSGQRPSLLGASCLAATRRSEWRAGGSKQLGVGLFLCNLGGSAPDRLSLSLSLSVRLPRAPSLT